MGQPRQSMAAVSRKDGTIQSVGRSVLTLDAHDGDEFSFDPATRALYWTPDYSSAGTYENVTFKVTDGVTQASAAVTILVTPTDQPPSLARPASRTLREGDRLRFFLQGGDACDGDLAAAYRACLESRIGLRVLWELARFPVDGDAELYAGVRGIEDRI